MSAERPQWGLGAMSLGGGKGAKTPEADESLTQGKNQPQDAH